MTALDQSPRPVGLSAAKRALLEQRLRGRRSAAVTPRPAGTSPPLSYAQERLWFMEQFAPGTGAYRVPLTVQFGPELDVAALRQALRGVVARHESLRMRFPTTADGRPVVVVAEPGDVPLPLVEVADEAAATAALAEGADEPFDLAAGPMLRALLVCLRDRGYRLLLVLHHIATDGWSTEIMLTDLLELYRAACAGEAPALAPLPVGYGDFAHWQRGEMGGTAARRDLAYWRQELTGVRALELPTDAPRPPKQTFDGQSHRFRLVPALVTELEAAGRAQGCTLFMTVLAGFQALLARYCGHDDFAVGSPVAGRSHAEIESVVGMFVNMLPLRARLGDDPRVADLLGRVRQTVLDGLSHQDVPFEKVIGDLNVTRDVSRSPLFQTMFALQNYEMGASVTWQPVFLPATRFDLELHAYADGGALECRFIYNTALFGPETVARLAGHLATLLTDLAARPRARVSELTLLGEAERELVINGWNATSGPERVKGTSGLEQLAGIAGREGVAGTVGLERLAGTLPALVGAQARRTPDAVALVAEPGTLTYAQLDAAANRVAQRLRALGVGPESVVAVCAERSTELVVGLLGALKAGAAYLPLDPDYPARRLEFMLADSGAPVVLTQRRLAATLPDSGATVLLLDDPSVWAGAPDTDPGPLAQAGNAAYLIYTSGSTGRPKGVLNNHRGIVNRLEWMQAEFGLGGDDVVLQKTPASFDVSVWEFFWPLLTGARLVLARPGGHRDPAYLRGLIDEHGVTTVHFVPSMLTAFLAEEVSGCRTLRRIVCSGEELPATLARRCVQSLPWARLANLYGPTEAAVDVTAWDCAPQALAGIARVPIGAPIHNVRTYVLDAWSRPVPIGAAGQLHLGGVQVSRGYHRRPGLTAERFVPDPYGPPGSRLYATGDLTRWRPDGTLEFLGRIDGQVKLRGLRIELGEIEAVLREQPGVRDVAVTIRGTPTGDQRIVGYLVGDVEVSVVRDGLRGRVPDYMVPSAFVPLDVLPLTPNGKLDRGALPSPEVDRSGDAELVAPRTEVERDLAALWRDILGVDLVGRDDNFFDLGGHSLLATQVVARLRPIAARTGAQVGVMDVFSHPTLRGLAAVIEEGTAGRPRRLLYELTRPVPAGQRTRSYVCVPYGGGSAAVYQPLADALPPGQALYSVAIPGHDVGLDEDSLPFDVLAERCVEEILERVTGPTVLYGHCGVGGALIVELALRLEEAGRELEAVYVGGVFPFARPKGVLSRLVDWFEDRATNRTHGNWLMSMGVDMSELDPAQADRIIANMRHDGRSAAAHFARLFDEGTATLRAPIISVVGSEDPITDYYHERYREWHFLTGTTAAVVLDEAGHFFLKHRAAELAEIVTQVHPALADGPAGPSGSAGRGPDAGPSGNAGSGPDAEPLGKAGRGPDAGWWLHEAHRTADDPPEDPAKVVAPSMRRFFAVTAGQLVSLTGSALTQFAIPVWIYLETGSLLWFGLFGVVAFGPSLLALPVAGAVADRFDRRAVMMVSCLGAGGAELAMGLLFWTDRLAVRHIYILVVLLSVASVFQRMAYTAAVPQLTPKRYLGHANGVSQMVNGFAMLAMPVLGAGLLASIGLGGILAIDIGSYLGALVILAWVRFPNLAGRRRRETFGAQLLGGLRYLWGNRSFRAILVYDAASNLFLALPLLLVTPLVLAFADLAQVGQVAFAEALGAVAGGLAMAIWGGPRRRLMFGNLVTILVVAAFCVLTGVRASVLVIAVGMFGTALALAVANGIFLTLLQVKVPQRFHGRVMALNMTIGWSTFPIGFGILAPLAGRYLEPLLADGGALAPTVGGVIGTGPGRGIAFACVLAGLGIAGVTLVALRVKRLARADELLPDAVADDLVGLRIREERLAARERVAA